MCVCFVVAVVDVVVAAVVVLFLKFAPGLHLHSRFVFGFLLYARLGALRPCFLENARLWIMGSICWGLYVVDAVVAFSCFVLFCCYCC